MTSPGIFLLRLTFPVRDGIFLCAPLADLPVAEKKELELRRRLDGHLPIRGGQFAQLSGTGAFRKESPFPGCDKYRPSLPRVLRRGQGQVERGRSADPGNGSRQDIRGTEGARLPLPPPGIVPRLPLDEVDVEPVFQIFRQGLGEKRGDPLPLFHTDGLRRNQGDDLPARPGLGKEHPAGEQSDRDDEEGARPHLMSEETFLNSGVAATLRSSNIAVSVLMTAQPASRRACRPLW